MGFVGSFEKDGDEIYICDCCDKRGKKKKMKKSIIKNIKITALPAIKNAKKTLKENGGKTNHKTLC